MTDLLLFGGGVIATALFVVAVVRWLERGERDDAWARSPERKAARDAWVAAQGPRVGETARYYGETKRRHDGAVLVHGALVRVARRYRQLDGTLHAAVVDRQGQRHSVAVSDLRDVWDREAA